MICIKQVIVTTFLNLNILFFRLANIRLTKNSHTNYVGHKAIYTNASNHEKLTESKLSFGPRHFITSKHVSPQY